MSHADQLIPPVWPRIGAAIRSLLPLFVLLGTASPTRADEGLLRTVHTLDEARGYCLDIAGAEPTLRLDDPLQVHTCKYGDPLDGRRFERTSAGGIKATQYDRCLAAAELAPGAKLLMRACGSAATQRWSMSWGRLSPESLDFIDRTIRR